MTKAEGSNETGKEEKMDIISKFDSANAQAAHGGTILADTILPAGLRSPFDHA